MKRMQIGLITLAALLAFGVAAQQPSRTSEAPLDIAQKYVQLFKARTPLKALETYWDFDALFQGIFGDDLKRHPPADIAEMKQKLTDLLKGIYANPQVIDAMANASYTDYKAK